MIARARAIISCPIEWIRKREFCPCNRAARGSGIPEPLRIFFVAADIEQSELVAILRRHKVLLKMATGPEKGYRSWRQITMSGSCYKFETLRSGSFCDGRRYVTEQKNLEASGGLGQPTLA